MTVDNTPFKGPVISVLDDRMDALAEAQEQATRAETAVQIAELETRAQTAEQHAIEVQAAYDAHLKLKAPAGHPTDEEPPPPPPPGRTPIVNRLYVCHEGILTQAQANAARTSIPSALGGSTRQRWDDLESDPTRTDRMLTIFRNAGCTFVAGRLISGWKMPKSKMGRTLAAGSVVFPAPCEANGQPNQVFIDNLAVEMEKMALVLLKHADAVDEEEPILHWPWFAKEWSEIYYGPEAQRDCSKAEFLAAHIALIDAAADLAETYPRLITGFQLSGHGPIQDIVDDLARHIAAVFPTEKAIIHANGLSYRGQWGQANPDVDAQMDAAFEVAAADAPDLPGFDELLVGLQAIQPFGQNEAQYTAAQYRDLYGQVRAAYGSSVELYLPSFTALPAASLTALETETARWIKES